MCTKSKFVNKKIIKKYLFCCLTTEMSFDIIIVHLGARLAKNLYSSVAQWWSTRLLTDRLEVRALSGEPKRM